MSKKIVQLNEEVIKGELKDLVRNSVKETLNGLLEQEAQALTNAARYERSAERQGYRSGHYSRNLTTTSGDVTEDEVRQVFLIIRSLLTSGKLQSIKQVIDTYVQKIEVFPDRVTVIFNFFPDITLDMGAALTVQNEDEGCLATQPSSGITYQHSITTKSADVFGGEGGI